MVDRSKEFNEFFQETYALFEQTTKYAKLLENLGHKVEVTYINELRSVLFHLYSYLDKSCENDPKKFDENYFAAREHLYRSYYDVFSLICAITIKQIFKYSEDYPQRIIYKAFPKYFDKISPELLKIQQLIAKIHSSKELNELLSLHIDPELTLAKKIEKNDGIITLLINWQEELYLHVRLFVEYQKKEIEEAKAEEVKEIKESKRFRVSVTTTIIVAVSVMLLTATITYLVLMPRQVQLERSERKDTTSKSK